MAPTKIFEKTLSKPTLRRGWLFQLRNWLSCLSSATTIVLVDLRIEDETGRIHPVRCTIRLKKHKKPELSSGWPMLVRCLGLKEKDEVTFFKLGEGHLKIQVMKKANGEKSTENTNIKAEGDHQPYQPAVAEQAKNITAVVHSARSGYLFEYDQIDGEEERKPIKLFGVVIGYGPDHRATS